MINFLYSLSNLELLFFLFFIYTLFSLCIYIILRRIPLLEFTDNEAASLSTVAQTVGIVYALLSGFTVAYVMNNFDRADTVVLDEATTITNIYRDARLLPSPERQEVQALTKQYIEAVLQQEWPDLVQGKINSMAANTLINQITRTIYASEVYNSSEGEVDIQTDLLNKCDTLYSTHEERLALAGSALNSDIWAVLIITTFILIVITLLFPMRRGLSFVAIVSVSFIVSVLFFLILALDRPFRGEYSVKPDAFETALARMNS